MNGGTVPTRPPRNHARPVSFHSTPEHQRNTPVYLAPHPHRRPRTPRSSPLAGPSVSSDQVDSENKDEEGNQKPRYRPNRISSIPDMVVPIQSLYDSDTASLTPSSSPPSISNGAIGIIFPRSSIPKSSCSSSSGEDDREKESAKGKEDIEDGSILRSFVKRLSIVSLVSLTTNEKDKDDQKTSEQRSGFISHSASMTSLASSSSSRTVWTDGVGQAAPPIPTIPRWALNTMREEAGAANRSMKYGHRRGTSDDPTSSSSLSNRPIPRAVRPSTSGSPSISRDPTDSWASVVVRPSTAGSPSISHDPTQNWVSLTDSTPRFSRLGLESDSVVMPMSKKEGLAKRESAASIRSMRSAATLSQSVVANCDSGVTSKTESSPGMDTSGESNAVNTKPSLKEEDLWKRASWSSSLRAKIPKISTTSSARNEDVPPLPFTISKPIPLSTSVTTLHPSLSTPNPNFAQKTLKASISSPSIVASPSFTKSATLRKDSFLAAIDQSRLPSSSPGATPTEFGGRLGNVKSQDTQKSKTARKTIKQFVMRITTAPMSPGEKLKVTTIHDSPSTPVVVPSPDTFMPLDPPPRRRFNPLASSSVPSLPSTKETPEFGHNRGDIRSSKKFKGIRKRWNAVLGTVRG